MLFYASATTTSGAAGSTTIPPQTSIHLDGNSASSTPAPGTTAVTGTTTSPVSPNLAASTNGTSTQSTDSGHKSDAGAIAGGVVGGLAALGLIAGAVIFFRHRSKKQELRTNVAEVSQI